MLGVDGEGCRRVANEAAKRYGTYVAACRIGVADEAAAAVRRIRVARVRAD